jgi:selenophosphate synthase
VSRANDALTSLSHGAGCGCKLPADALLPIVNDADDFAEDRAAQVPSPVVGRVVAGEPGTIVRS